MTRAQAVNAHLPRDVRVLSCQRVNSGFSARERCGDRTYHYYLPASVLDLSPAGAYSFVSEDCLPTS